MELRPDDISEILRIFADSDLEELRLDIGETRLELSKHSGSGLGHRDPPLGRPSTAPVAAAPVAGAIGAVPVTPPALPSAPPASHDDAVADEGLVEVRSPVLGIFYRRPSPDKPPFVEIGSIVAADDPVCIVDVMKMFTRIPAGTAGRVVAIYAEDGQLVEHGQVLMRIDPR